MISSPILHERINMKKIIRHRIYQGCLETVVQETCQTTPHPRLFSAQNNNSQSNSRDFCPIQLDRPDLSRITNKTMFPLISATNISISAVSIPAQGLRHRIELIPNRTIRNQCGCVLKPETKPIYVFTNLISSRVTHYSPKQLRAWHATL